jgi:hypothetical protein
MSATAIAPPIMMNSPTLPSIMLLRPMPKSRSDLRREGRGVVGPGLGAKAAGLGRGWAAERGEPVAAAAAAAASCGLAALVARGGSCTHALGFEAWHRGAPVEAAEESRLGLAAAGILGGRLAHERLLCAATPPGERQRERQGRMLRGAPEHHRLVPIDRRAVGGRERPPSRSELHRGGSRQVRGGVVSAAGATLSLAGRPGASGPEQGHCAGIAGGAAAPAAAGVVRERCASSAMRAGSARGRWTARPRGSTELAVALAASGRRVMGSAADSLHGWSSGDWTAPSGLRGVRCGLQ